MRPVAYLAVLMLNFASHGALAQSASADPSDSQVSPEDAQQIAMALATCAGVWDAMSLASAADDAPASAEQFHNMGNGAAVPGSTRTLSRARR